MLRESQAKWRVDHDDELHNHEHKFKAGDFVRRNELYAYTADDVIADKFKRLDEKALMFLEEE